MEQQGQWRDDSLDENGKTVNNAKIRKNFHCDGYRTDGGVILQPQAGG